MQRRTNLHFTHRSSRSSYMVHRIHAIRYDVNSGLNSSSYAAVVALLLEYWPWELGIMDLISHLRNKVESILWSSHLYQCLVTTHILMLAIIQYKIF